MSKQTNVVTVAEPQGRLVAKMADEYEIEPRVFISTLKATVVPKDMTNEEMAQFLMIAHRYHLNPFLREIYAFRASEKRGGGIITIVGIDGWANLINQHPAFDGAEFTEHRDKNQKTNGITCRIHRKDRAQPIAVTEYLAECKRNTEPWQQWPMRMLRHRALIQCARYAFGFAGLVDPDEAEYDQMRDVTPIAGRDAGPPLPPETFEQLPPGVEVTTNEAGEIDNITITQGQRIVNEPEMNPANGNEPAERDHIDRNIGNPDTAPPPRSAVLPAPKTSEQYSDLVAHKIASCNNRNDIMALRAWFVSDQQRKARLEVGMSVDDAKKLRDDINAVYAQYEQQH